MHSEDGYQKKLSRTATEGDDAKCRCDSIYLFSVCLFVASTVHIQWSEWKFQKHF